ncbi:unnamed protein product [Ilex paraguariensis]|uniref:Uncharacterized protein n=1 Tax=Ilex paraguariensis TaxID=185542 RepID=A0ABC8SLW8_9AQUA
MERRKTRGSIDELAIVKAAAWAWYQRGSGSEARSMREYDLTRPSRAPKPSRYKLEAMAMEGSTSTSPSPCHSTGDTSLFDMYEKERISKQLDDYIKASHIQYYGGFHGGGDRSIVSVSESGVKRKEKKKKKKRKGFWLMQAVTCGSRDDVVDSIGFGGGGLRSPEKQVPVVRVANYRPRTTHA